MAVSGTVTLNDLPLGLGVIRFIPENHSGPAASTEIVGGEFVFTSDDGPVIGTHRVEIEATGYQRFDIDDEVAFAASMMRTGKSPLATNPVPANYNRASTLKAEVTPSETQRFQFDLKTAPK